MYNLDNVPDSMHSTNTTLPHDQDENSKLNNTACETTYERGKLLITFFDNDRTYRETHDTVSLTE